MNRTLKYISLSVLCAGISLAQQGNPPTPATMVQHQVAHLTQSLGLNSSQQAQATTIFTTEMSANQPIMASLKTARTSLTAAIKSNNTGDIATISNQIGNLQGQMVANGATANAQFYAILTPAQQAEYHVDSGFGGRGFGGPAGAFRGRGGAAQ
jgi:Spy/CpxP family protein refolding chaperone